MKPFDLNLNCKTNSVSYAFFLNQGFNDRTHILCENIHVTVPHETESICSSFSFCACHFLCNGHANMFSGVSTEVKLLHSSLGSLAPVSKLHRPCTPGHASMQNIHAKIFRFESYNYNYTTLHYATQHWTIRHYSTQHYTTRHYTTVRYTYYTTPPLRLQLQLQLQLHYTSYTTTTTPLNYNYNYNCTTTHYIQQLWVR